MVTKAGFVADPDLIDDSFWRGYTLDDRAATEVTVETGAKTDIAASSIPRIMLGTSVSSHGRALKRKSAVVSAPTGQTSVVLPLK